MSLIYLTDSVTYRSAASMKTKFFQTFQKENKKH